MTSPRSVAAGLCASALQLSSPATTPTLSSSAGSGWPRLGYVPEISACARLGPALLTSCAGCRLLLLHHCSYRLPALHAGRAAFAVAPVNAVWEQTVEVLVVSPGASGKVVIGEPERVVRWLAGEAGGCGSCPGAVEEERDIAVGRGGVELEAADDDDDDVVVGGGVVAEVPAGAVTSSPSCDPWMSQGC